MKKMQIRHGDLLVESCNQIPQGAKERKTNVILDGEVTGHTHRLIGGTILDVDEATYLTVPETATIVHEEHNTVVLPAGDYIVTRQREFDPYEKAARQVQD